MSKGELKIGALAELTGLSVRTLHHYHEIGLLVPADRSRTGHRVYETDQVVRLYQIRALQSLGLPLREIGEMLAEPVPAKDQLERVLERQASHLESRIRSDQAALKRIDELSKRIHRTDDSVDELGQMLLEMELFSTYYTADQLRRLEERRREVGQQRIEDAQREWAELIAEVRSEMERKADPSDESVLRLARQWTGLIEEFTGGDPELAAAAARVNREERALTASMGLDASVMEFIGRSIAVLNRPDAT